ncbi:winged helix-turn-helix domain-containing protein [Aliikangiella sp. G2MR2-5]|uniref:winged helix-turn-helix domain-containing protein n=1 Tax=Aliikangiella sp. G2MR2-5 TaxID=2788943 RepID=UPI0018AAAA5D|nr:winged helix-turn-helix domain-containing protein [Aliikangiella sp. G2MR2-5]
MTISINDWTLYQDENRLRRGTETIQLQPLCVKALLLFAENSGHLVSRETLIEKVWNGRVVSEDAINNCIKKIRKALGDNPKTPTQLETIPKKGYRLIENTQSHLANTAEIPPLKKNRSTKIYASFLLIACTGVTLTLVLSGFPFSLDVVHISPEMSEQEKQRSYSQILEKTRNGGHLVKLDMTSDTSSKLDKSGSSK